MLLCRCVLLCTHLWDLVPRFRRHPFLDFGLESVCVCVCVCVSLVSRELRAPEFRAREMREREMPGCGSAFSV